MLAAAERRPFPDAGDDRPARPGARARDARDARAPAPFDVMAVGTDIQRRIGVKTVRDDPLGRFTTMRVGGPADLFVDRAQRVRAAIAREVRPRRAAIPHTLLGRGSDLVIADAGIRGLVIQVRAEGSQVDGERYTAEAGVAMARAATETQKAGLSGLEFGLAIPGTVGGAVWANAGAHDGDVAGILESATVLLADGREATLAADELALALPRQPVQAPAERGRASPRVPSTSCSARRSD